MSKRFVLTLITSLFCLSACQAGVGSPQPSPSDLPIAGGLSEQDPSSPQAQAMLTTASNLLNQKYPDAGIELTGLTRYRTQVVAGSNHYLTVSYTDKAGKSGSLELVVFRSLDDSSSLTEDNYQP